MTRCGTPIWMAARPMPGAKNMCVQHVVHQRAQGVVDAPTGFEIV